MNIIQQIDVVVQQLNDGWARERLRQISLFHAGESSLDSYYIEQLKEFEDEQNIENSIKNIRDIRKRLNNIFSIASSFLYDSFSMKDKKIIVGGVVSSDGSGDYFQMWLTANNLKQKIPEAVIAVSTNLGNHIFPKLQDSSQIIENLTFSSEEERQEKAVEEKLKFADLIINIPHGSLPNPAHKPELKIEEYGFSPGNAYSMGFSPMSDKILGIPFKFTSSAQSLIELSCTSLRTHLIEKKAPFFLGYLKKDHGEEEQHLTGFVLAAAAFHKKRSEDMDIIIPLKSLNKINKEGLLALNISRIILMECNLQGKLNEKEVLILGSSGKEIRILNPFPLSNDDWMLLLKFCEALVGCTGDVSFSEIISSRNKIPFYQIRWHKKSFIKQLIELTGYVYKDDFKKIHQFLLILSKNLEENSSELDISNVCIELGQMIDSEFIEEWKKFTTCIEKYYCTNEILPNLIKRQLAYVRYPELRKVEQRIYEKWIRNELSLQEALQDLQKELQNTI